MSDYILDIKNSIEGWIDENKIKGVISIQVNEMKGVYYATVKHLSPGTIIGNGGSRIKELCKRLHADTGIKVKVQVNK